MTRTSLVILALIGLLACRHSQLVQTRNEPAPSPAASPSAAEQWTADLAQFLDHNPDVKRVWTDFERSHTYRMAQPSDRNLSPEASTRVVRNGSNQIIPFLNWWGAHGYEGKTDFLAVIVVDPARTDRKRYGLVVFAAPKSGGPTFKPYWVLREEDMESYLLSGASGSFWVECFHRHGSEQTRELAWDKRSRQFRLL